jgi:hypothetical protein
MRWRCTSGWPGCGYGYDDYYARGNGKPGAAQGAVNRVKNVFARR